MERVLKKKFIMAKECHVIELIQVESILKERMSSFLENICKESLPTENLRKGIFQVIVCSSIF